MLFLKPMATLGHIRGRGPKTALAGFGRGRSEAEAVSEIIPSTGYLFHVEQTSSTKVDEKDGDVGGGDAGDAGGLGDSRWPIAHQFLAAFDGKGLYFVEVEVGGNLDVF